MTHDQTAELLKRAAVRLSNSYFEEVENERDSRWDGDMEKARGHRDEAEETLTLIEACRAAADRLTRDRDASLGGRGQPIGKGQRSGPFHRVVD